MLSRDWDLLTYFEHGNETSGTISSGEFIDSLNDLAFQGLCSLELISFLLGTFPSL